MGRETLWQLSDREYLRRDGENTMDGPLRLPGLPTEANQATQKAYVDALIAAINFLTPAQITTLINNAVAAGVAPYLPLAGGVLTGPLTLSGAPTLALHAATMAYADLMLPLAGGTMGGVLTLAADPLLAMQAATKQYVDALPVPGLDTFDATVDAAGGGDYVSIVTACATEAVSARIYVKAGTYNEAADILMKDGQMLVGQNPENTIIDFGSNNAQVTYTGAPTNLYMCNITIQNSIADWYVHWIGDFDRIDNCRFIGAGGASFGGVHMAGEKGVISRCTFTTFSRAGEYCIRIGEQSTVEGNYITTCQRGIYAEPHVTVIGNTIEAMTNQQVLLKGNTTLTGNVLNGAQKVMISGRETQIVGNYFFSASNIEWEVNDDGAVICGNGFYISTINCALAGVQRVTISGNTIVGGGPVTIDGQYFSITGNVFDDTSYLNFTANAEYNIAAGNNFGRSSAAVKIVDAGNVNHAYDNFGIPSLMEKYFLKMENTSGGALVAGDVIVFKAVAAGDEFTTTVNQGDDLVYGMLDEGIADAAYGYIQQLGKTTKLKVNGVINIGIGDLLGTFTAAGIAQQAQAGDMAFAIALEVYAGADSLGVIDALLIKPRKV